MTAVPQALPDFLAGAGFSALPLASAGLDKRYTRLVHLHDETSGYSCDLQLVVTLRELLALPDASTCDITLTTEAPDGTHISWGTVGLDVRELPARYEGILARMQRVWAAIVAG